MGIEIKCSCFNDAAACTWAAYQNGLNKSGNMAQRLCCCSGSARLWLLGWLVGVACGSCCMGVAPQTWNAYKRLRRWPPQRGGRQLTKKTLTATSATATTATATFAFLGRLMGVAVAFFGATKSRNKNLFISSCRCRCCCCTDDDVVCSDLTYYVYKNKFDSKCNAHNKYQKT